MTTTINLRSPALNDAETVLHGFSVIAYCPLPSELWVQSVGFAAANLWAFDDDSELNQVFNGSADVRFLHLQGFCNVYLCHLDVVFIVQLCKQSHEYTYLVMIQFVGDGE